MHFPIPIDGPVSTRAARCVRYLCPSGALFHIGTCYELLLELALADANEVASTVEDAPLDICNRVLERYDMAVGSLRPLVGVEVADLLMRRIDTIGLPHDVTDEVYRLQHGYTPTLSRAHGPPHMSLVRFVLTHFTHRGAHPEPMWMPAVDAVLATHGLRHYMQVADLFVDRSMPRRIARNPRYAIRRPVHMAYAKRIEWLELPGDVARRFTAECGMRFVFELGFVSPSAHASTLDDACVEATNRVLQSRGLYLRVGNLLDEPWPLARIRELGFGLLGETIIRKAGNCTLPAFVMQTPEELGLTAAETQHANEFLAHQGFRFGSNLHDLLYEVSDD